MTGKEAKGFFKDKFKQSLHKDIVFWISTMVSVVFAINDYMMNSEFHESFVEYIFAHWSFFGLWIGAIFLLTRNYNDTFHLKSHHFNSLCRILVLVMSLMIPFSIIILPVLGWWWVREKKRTLKEEPSSEKLNSRTSKKAIASLICSGLAVPLLFGITALQQWLISLGLIYRRDTVASPLLAFLVGVVLAIVGMSLWTSSRKHEGRNVWNFWAMRLIIVNVILAPFALIFIFIAAIGRGK